MSAETPRTNPESGNAKAPPGLSATDKGRTARGGDGHDGLPEAAEAATAMNREATDAMQSGQQTAVEFNQRAFELLQDQGRRAADTVSRFTSACHNAAESTMGDMRALTMAYAQFSCGMQEWQQACIDLAGRTTEHTIRAQQTLLGCRSPTELADAQKDLYCEAVGFVLRASNDMLQLGARIAQDAAKPLQGRTQPYAQRG